MTSKRYYTLAIREDGSWQPYFGAYSRADVLAERDDRRDHFMKLRDLKVLVTTDEQTAINAAINELNSTP